MVSIAGRIMSKSIMGKAAFAKLQDSKGRIQVYVQRDSICPGENKDLYNIVFKKLLDLGDFIGVKGYVPYKDRRDQRSRNGDDSIEQEPEATACS